LRVHLEKIGTELSESRLGGILKQEGYVMKAKIVKKVSIMKRLLSTVLVLAQLATALAFPERAAAYNVCSDDDACTHEVMTEQGLDLYYYYHKKQAMPNPVAQEIKDHWEIIKEGVGNPDEFDPLYGNAGFGDALVTISHFWSPDDNLEEPMVFGLDDYPNAFNAAQSLWTRALGEYAAGNKKNAYQYLGMVAHFLGDQTIPTHAHNDVHGPDIIQDDSYEEWMSEGAPSPRAKLTDSELIDLQTQGILINPMHETDDQLLWLFLTTNQIADFFASDDFDGDSKEPSDPYVQGWIQADLDFVQAACNTEPNGCPTTTNRLIDNDVFCYFEVDRTKICDANISNNNDDDGDLSLIRKYSYLRGIRAMGALFALWAEAISKPILTVTIHEIKEIGDYEGNCTIFSSPCSGMDSWLKPDYYVGIVMGRNERNCDSGNCPDPIGSYLEDSNGNIRNINGGDFQSNVTRYDAFQDNSDIAWDVIDKDRHGTEDQNVVKPDYHFGQSYSYASGAGGYVSGDDIVDITLAVWENDESAEIFNDPYDSDDPADINPSPLTISVDLAKCASGASDAVTIGDVSDYSCDSSISRQGTGDDTNDVKVVFSITIFRPPNQAPTADAGGPYTVLEDQSIVLDGSDSSDSNGDPLTFAWDLDNDGAFDDATNAKPTFSAVGRTGPDTQIIWLRVSDGTDNSEPVMAIVTIERVWIATHVMRENETFSHLALQYHGHATPYYWQWIIDANQGNIPIIYRYTQPGTTIYIPKPPPVEMNNK
jgi:hypothetical protein